MDLFQNPFYILNASPRDGRRRIVEMADERSLLFDGSECMEARATLTNPRRRLSAEVAWLPGIGPRRTASLLSLVESSPRNVLDVDDLLPIARTNLLVAGFARLDYLSADDDLEYWIHRIANSFEEVTLHDSLEIINEERVVAGFTEVSDLSALEAEIQERRVYFCSAMKSALERIGRREFVETVTLAVENATSDGEEHGPVLIADLVDRYELYVQKFLEEEEVRIRSLVEKLRAAVDRGEADSSLADMVSQLIVMVKEWDVLAQPIQVCTKSRGLDHDASHRVAGLVRELAIHMYNEHGKLDLSRRLTGMQGEVFAEVVKFAELTAGDAEALDEIRGNESLYLLTEVCEKALESANKSPHTAESEARDIMNVAPKLIADMRQAQRDAGVIDLGKDQIAVALMHCAVVFGNRTKCWSRCIGILDEAMKYAASDDVKAKVRQNRLVAVANRKIYSNDYSPTFHRVNMIVSGVVFMLLLILVILESLITQMPESRPSSQRSLSNSAVVVEEVRDAQIEGGIVRRNSEQSIQYPSPRQTEALQYTRPSVGTNNVLSMPEIRWCVREGIRIEAMRHVINTNAGINEFNRMVDEYNSRCGSYRYRQGSQSRAEREVEAYRSQIVAEAIDEARQIDSLSSPSVSPGASTSSIPKKPNAQYTEEAQQLLTDLGYDPGPVDGDYGRWTSDAVKSFQRDVGITQDGWIDEELLDRLRSAKAAYKPPVSQPKPQSQTNIQGRSSPPPVTDTAKPENLSYEDQFKYVTAQRLRRLGYDVDWRTSSLTDMLDAKSRIGTANRLSRLGYKVDWRTSSLTDMLDAESRIGTANRLKRKGISIDWRNYSLTQLLNMEYGQN